MFILQFEEQISHKISNLIVQVLSIYAQIRNLIFFLSHDTVCVDLFPFNKDKTAQWDY